MSGWFVTVGTEQKSRFYTKTENLEFISGHLGTPMLKVSPVAGIKYLVIGILLIFQNSLFVYSGAYQE